MASPPRASRCRTHPTNPAGWTCEECNSPLCPACVAEQVYGSTSVEACSRCGGRAVQLKLHRSHRSYASRLIDSVRFLVKPPTLMSIAALGLFGTVMSWFSGLIALIISGGALWAYLFHVFLAGARGVELDVPDFTSISDLTRPLFRGIVSSLYIWVPVVIYVLFGSNWGPSDPLWVVFSDPIVHLLLGWGLFYGPMAFIMAATNTSLWNLLNPVALVSWAFKLGLDYLIALGVVMVSLGLHVGVGLLGALVAGAQLPFLSRLIPHILGLIMPFFMAHVLGQLLYVKGDKVGYGMDEDYYEPVFPGARPQGRLPSKAQAPSAPAQEGGVASRMAAVLSSVPRAESTVDSGESLRAVVDAVSSRDSAGAVLAYQGLQSSAHVRLAPEQHLFVGRAAAGSGDFELAAKAFETAADVAPDSPVAPQALVLLARLCAERIQDPARAQSVYQYIVHRYPNTDASRFAEQRLTPGA